VSVGGSTVLAIPLNYTYENFLEQTALYEKLIKLIWVFPVV
jgi:hypothetical protein